MSNPERVLDYRPLSDCFEGPMIELFGLDAPWVRYSLVSDKVADLVVMFVRRFSGIDGGGSGDSPSHRCANHNPPAIHPSAASIPTVNASPRNAAPSSAAVNGLSAMKTVTRVAVVWASDQSQR